MKRLIHSIALCVMALLPAQLGQGIVHREFPMPETTVKTPSVRRLMANIDDVIFKAAAAYGVDPALIAAIIQVESSFNPYARSPQGAMGLMQLMPSTARSLGVGAPFDPVQNVFGGTKYVRELLDLFRGNIHLALAAYNAGPGNVQKYGWVPPFRETRAYIPRVLHYYRRFTELLRG